MYSIIEINKITDIDSPTLIRWAREMKKELFFDIHEATCRIAAFVNDTDALDLIERAKLSIDTSSPTNNDLSVNRSRSLYHRLTPYGGLLPWEK